MRQLCHVGLLVKQNISSILINQYNIHIYNFKYKPAFYQQTIWYGIIQRKWVCTHSVFYVHKILYKPIGKQSKKEEKVTDTNTPWRDPSAFYLISIGDRNDTQNSVNLPFRVFESDQVTTAPLRGQMWTTRIFYSNEAQFCTPHNWSANNHHKLWRQML